MDKDRLAGNKFGKKMQAVFRAALRQLYPDRCPVCDRVLYDRLICPSCAARLKYAGEPACFCCGRPAAESRQEYCADCACGRHVFAQGRAVFCYEGAVRRMLYRYKYSGRRDYTEFFAREARRIYGTWVRQREVELIIPIPLSKKKMRRRGYNQAEVFARRFSQLAGIPCGAGLLVRTRDTVPQKYLSAAQRKNNLKNAFKISGNVVNLKSILLVDDIYTTGSTMNAAALVFKQAGVHNVYFLCISIGQGQ